MDSMVMVVTDTLDSALTRAVEEVAVMVTEATGYSGMGGRFLS